jgi:hypothetical protein
VTDRTLADLQPGETCYSLPWGLHKAQGQWWLNPNYPAETQPGGTVQMRVRRLGDRYTAWPVNHDDFPRGGRVEVAGLAPWGGPRIKETHPSAGALEQLAVMWDELGEPDLANLQRELAAQLRAWNLSAGDRP